MIKFNVNTTDINDKELMKALKLTMNDWRDYVFGRSQEYVPKNYSHLMSSADISIDQDYHKEITYGGVLGVNYAEYVEFGTDRMIKAHGEHDPRNPVKSWKAKRKRGAYDLQQMPYLRPAFYEANDKLNTWAKKHIKKVKKPH